MAVLLENIRFAPDENLRLLRWRGNARSLPSLKVVCEGEDDVRARLLNEIRSPNNERMKKDDDGLDGMMAGDGFQFSNHLSSSNALANRWPMAFCAALSK
jgi:hypothetical protein